MHVPAAVVGCPDDDFGRRDLGLAHERVSHLRVPDDHLRRSDHQLSRPDHDLGRSYYLVCRAYDH
jgi:hypothetical protein